MLYGGAAGGGKSSLLVALAILYHRRALLLRRSFPDLERTLILRSLELYGNEHCYNASKHVWFFPDTNQRIEFGHIKDVNSMRQDFSGPEYDFIGFDELTQFTRDMYLFMLSRLRSSFPGQRVRVVAGSNPGDIGNDWVIEHWAPWLLDGYPNPAKPGELRWFITDEHGQSREVDADHPDAVSRTFIPATLEDNPYLSEEYRRQLALLPEPWRLQLLYGRWQLGHDDDPYQVIPTAWLKQAQARWRPDGKQTLQPVVGIDPARGGRDKTVLIARYGNWVAPPTKVSGRLTPDGQSVINLLLPLLGRGGRGVLDVIGLGAAVEDVGKAMHLPLACINISSPTTLTDRSGKLKMINLRAWLYWRLREALDPEGPQPLALPMDPELFNELRAVRWEHTLRGIKIVDKDDITDRLGHSPNCADALSLTMYEPPTPRGGTARVF